MTKGPSAFLPFTRKVTAIGLTPTRTYLGQYVAVGEVEGYEVELRFINEIRSSGMSQQAVPAFQVTVTPRLPLPQGLTVHREKTVHPAIDRSGGQTYRLLRGFEVFSRGQGVEALLSVTALRKWIVDHVDDHCFFRYGGLTLEYTSGWASTERLQALVETSVRRMREFEGLRNWKNRRAEGVEFPELVHPLSIGAKAPATATTSVTDEAPATGNMGALMTELAAGGEVASEGTFSLDRAKALQKLREALFETPETYVVEVLRCAVLRGATRVSFEYDNDDFWIRFDGTPFDPAELEVLFESIHGDRTDPRTLSRRHLGLAVYAAGRLKPRSIRFRTDTCLLETDESAELKLTVAPDLGGAQEFHVRLGLGARMRGDTHRRTARILRDRAQYMDIPVYGSNPKVSLSHGLGRDGVMLPQRIEQDMRRIHAGFTAAMDAGAAGPRIKPRVVLAQQGVWQQILELEEGPDGFVAVVDDPMLRTELGGDAVIRDAAFDRAMWAVQNAIPRCLDQLLDTMKAEDDAEKWPEGRWAADARIRHLSRRFLHRLAHEDGVGAKLWACRCWPTLRGRATSLEVLSARVRNGFTLEVSNKSHGGYDAWTGAEIDAMGHPRSTLDASLLHDAGDLELLLHLFGPKLHDVEVR